MDDKQIQLDKQELKHILDEYLERIRQSGKKETSDLVGDVKLSHGEIKVVLDEIKRRLDTANGYTAKHEQRLNNQDIMNAQTTISQQQTANSLAMLIASDKANTEDRIGRNGFNVRMQWILGFIGFGTFTLVAKYIFKAF